MQQTSLRLAAGCWMGSRRVPDGFSPGELLRGLKAAVYLSPLLSPTPRRGPEGEWAKATVRGRQGTGLGWGRRAPAAGALALGEREWGS